MQKIKKLSLLLAAIITLSTAATACEVPFLNQNSSQVESSLEVNSSEESSTSSVEGSSRESEDSVVEKAVH
jgi:hypothetical protein